MNLQNHKQQEINFNKEANPSSQNQQKLDFSNPTQKQSQVKLNSKSTASNFKNQSLESRQENREKQTKSNLTSLSDSNLLSQTKILAQKERKITVEVLEHLCEIDQRKLYLKKGFSSLFDYTTKELGYSEGAACRRIKAMKLCREIPEITSKIQTGHINLTTASKAQTFFEKQNKQPSKLRRSDSSQRRNVASFLPDQNQSSLEDQKQLSLKDQKKSDLKNQNKYLESQNQSELRRSDSSQRRNVASILENQSLETEQEEGENQTQEEQVKQIQENQKSEKLKLLKKIEGKSGRQTEQLLQEIDPTIQKSKRKVRHLNQDQVEVKIVLNKKAYEGMNQLKHLLSHKNLSEGEVFALLINLGLKKYDPRKYKTREDKKTQSQVQSSQNQFATNSGVKKSQVVSEKKEIKERIKNHEEFTSRSLQNNYEKYITRNLQNSNQAIQKTNSIKKTSRYISAKIRKQVWLRDEGRCTYTCSQTKRRCNSQHFLQVDHIQPYALGGSHEIKNLRLLCASHNQYRPYSPDFQTPHNKTHHPISKLHIENPTHPILELHNNPHSL